MPHSKAASPSDNGTLRCEYCLCNGKHSPKNCTSRYNPASTAVHLSCAVELFDRVPDDMEALRNKLLGTAKPVKAEQPAACQPFLRVWEPVFNKIPRKEEVTDASKEAFRKLCDHFDVVALHHTYLASMSPYNQTTLTNLRRLAISHKKGKARYLLETHASALLTSDVGSTKLRTVVVLSGTEGCLVALRLPGNKLQIKCCWLPPAYDHVFADMDKTIDTKIGKQYAIPGAATFFVGALTYAMAYEGMTAVEAAKRAAVAVTFLLDHKNTLEEVGSLKSWHEYKAPLLEHWVSDAQFDEIKDGKTSLNLPRDFRPRMRNGEEYWNWTTLARRVAVYTEREKRGLGGTLATETLRKEAAALSRVVRDEQKAAQNEVLVCADGFRPRWRAY